MQNNRYKLLIIMDISMHLIEINDASQRAFYTWTDLYLIPHPPISDTFVSFERFFSTLNK